MLSSIQSLSCVQFFVTPWTAAHQASLFIINSRSLLKVMSTESVMLSNHLILCRSLFLQPSLFPYTTLFRSSFCLQSFPASGSFPRNLFFASGGQRIGVSASASVLPKKDRKSTRLNSSHRLTSRMPSSA